MTQIWGLANVWILIHSPQCIHLFTFSLLQVSTSEHGAQHHIYRLVKDWTRQARKPGVAWKINDSKTIPDPRISGSRVSSPPVATAWQREGLIVRTGPVKVVNSPTLHKLLSFQQSSLKLRLKTHIVDRASFQLKLITCSNLVYTF